MGYLKVIFLFIYIICVFANEDDLLTPCAVEDMQCLSKSTESFLNKTAAGIPQYNLKPIDPMFIPKVCGPGSKGVVFHFHNLTVTGIKNLKIEKFEMDKESKSVLLSTKANFNVDSDIIIELTDVKKTFSGTYKTKTTAIGTMRYNYELKTDDKGVEHFDVGPETITCNALTEPVVTIGPELVEALEKDPDAQTKKNEYYTEKVKNRKAAACKIIEEALVTVVHNIRACAKAVPKSLFFTNV